MNDAGRYQPTARRKESLLHQSIFKFQISIKTKQALSDSSKDLMWPLCRRWRPCCAFRFTPATALLLTRVLEAPWRNGVVGRWEKEESRKGGIHAPAPAHLCMRSCSSRCLRISGNCFS